MGQSIGLLKLSPELEGLEGPEHGVPAYLEFPAARDALAMGDSGDGD